jgi:hypothetical protein
VNTQADLLDVVAAGGAASCGPSSLNSGQQQGYQNADDGDNDKKLYQCKTWSPLAAMR